MTSKNKTSEAKKVLSSVVEQKNRKSESESSDSESSDSDDEMNPLESTSEIKKSEKVSTKNFKNKKNPKEEIRTENSEKKKKRKRKRQPKNKNKLPKPEIEKLIAEQQQISIEKAEPQNVKEKQNLTTKQKKNEFSSAPNKNPKHIFFGEEETCKSSSSSQSNLEPAASSTSVDTERVFKSKSSINDVIGSTERTSQSNGVTASNPKVTDNIANVKQTSVVTNSANGGPSKQDLKMKPATLGTSDVTGGQKSQYAANSEEVSCEQMILGQVCSLKPAKIEKSQNPVAGLPNGNKARLPNGKPLNGTPFSGPKIVEPEKKKVAARVPNPVEPNGRNENKSASSSRSVRDDKHLGRNSNENQQSIIQNLLSLASSGKPLKGSRQRKSDVWTNRSVVLENTSDLDPPEHPSEHPESSKLSSEHQKSADVSIEQLESGELSSESLELSSEQAEETFEAPEPHSFGDISRYPLLEVPPAENSIVAFKILEMSANYSPGNLNVFH